jgi:ribosomal protein S18 acetylase RimI-like enzyme
LYSGTEAEVTAWLELCRQGQLLPENPPESGVDADWFQVLVVNWDGMVPAEDAVFVLDTGGSPVATLCAVKLSDGQGYIHMVATRPDCRGKGIGHATLALGLTKLEAQGCPHSYLTTDDFRLAAIKTYLDAGFRPVLLNDPESDHRARWDAVIAALGYSPVEYFTEV